jgi:integral membrane protein (TIGR01906 family)
MKMKILATSAKWLFMLSLPILLLTASLGWTTSSLWLYKYGFEKYNVGQTTSLASSELDKVARGLIGYFNSDEEYISLTVVKDNKLFALFKQREILHLKDVKGLIRLDYLLLAGTLVYVLAYTGFCLFWRKRRYRRLAWGLVGGGGITLGLMLALGLGAVFGFDQLFWQFHVLSFSNEFWRLDPTRDYLIMLFPRDFFRDGALLCAGITIGLAIILGGLGGGYLRFAKRARG